MIYVASRASLPARPAMWKRLRSQGWPINSTWIDEAGPGETASLTELWDRIEREIRAADYVILYAECDDFPLKGAYIECGMALGMGKPVAVVLDFTPDTRNCSPIGSWIKHPLVSMHDTVEDARAYLDSTYGVTVGRGETFSPPHAHGSGSKQEA
jgi:hypothetical protein